MRLRPRGRPSFFHIGLSFHRAASALAHDLVSAPGAQAPCGLRRPGPTQGDGAECRREQRDEGANAGRRKLLDTRAGVEQRR